MNSLELLKQLNKYPVFSIEKFASVADLDAPTARVRAFRMKKRGYLSEIMRNVYTTNPDPLVIASRITWPSYISLWYALSYHGLTTQVPHSITVLTTRRLFRSEVEFSSTVIRFVKIKPDYLFGFDRVRIGDNEIFMAKPEKAIIDAILLKRISIPEVCEILMDNKARLDLKLLVDYAIRCDNAALSKRLGLILDSLGYTMTDALLEHAYKTPIPLDHTRPNGKKLDRKWGVWDNMVASE